MNRLDFYSSLAVPNERRILLMVLDGLGGLPHPATGLTELEAASTPALDKLALRAELGLTTPILPGITPGSGPAHIALFGFDPIRHQVGRGVLAALGVGADLRAGDVAARINFCTLDGAGNVVDRRAGRAGDEVVEPLARRLDAIPDPPEAAISVRHVKQYRACVVFRAPGLDGRVADTDPQAVGVPPLEPQAMDPGAAGMAAIASSFIAHARGALADQDAANGVLLRGFDNYAPFPSLGELYGLRPAAVAAYPMYLGVARLAGMEAHGVADDPEILRQKVLELDTNDFVFLHYKSTDSRGEDGDFDAKVAEIEKADALLGSIADEFDVVLVTGDHSTPSRMRAHSWHPVPVLLASDCSRGTGVGSFGEQACAAGGLGHIRSTDILPLVLAHAGKLRKYGA